MNEEQQRKTAAVVAMAMLNQKKLAQQAEILSGKSTKRNAEMQKVLDHFKTPEFTVTMIRHMEKIGQIPPTKISDKELTDFLIGKSMLAISTKPGESAQKVRDMYKTPAFKNSLVKHLQATKQIPESQSQIFKRENGTWLTSKELEAMPGNKMEIPGWDEAYYAAKLNEDLPATRMDEARKKGMQEMYAAHLREIQNIEEHEGLYAGMVISETEFLGDDRPDLKLPRLFRKIDVYLINNTDIRYPNVKRLTGAFCSIDEDLMETGKKVSGPFAIEPRSVYKIEGSDTGELDFVVWYDLDMTDEFGNYSQARFSLPKPYEWDDQTHLILPFVEQEGMRLELNGREQSIDDYVKENGTKPRYFEYRDGQMIQRE